MKQAADCEDAFRRSELSRRSFIKQTSLAMLALKTTAANPARIGLHSLIRDGDPAPVRNQLLNLVNDERVAAGSYTLKLDELACRVAQSHALDMAENGFLSHWDRNGLKPYHRYSFAGGTEAIEENDGATDHGDPVPAEEITPEIIGLHKAMFGEYPPNDGHRKTILGPQHTHVGFGLACSGTHVRLSEIYVARYASIDPYPAVLKAGKGFMFSGRILDSGYTVKSIDVFYEALASKSNLPALPPPEPYGLPDERETLLLKLPDKTLYEDGSRGSIVMHGREFRVPIILGRKRPGIYTIGLWLQRFQIGKPFLATQACVRAE